MAPGLVFRANAAALGARRADRRKAFIVAVLFGDDAAAKAEGGDDETTPHQPLRRFLVLRWFV